MVNSNEYLRNSKNRFTISNFTGDTKLPYGIVDKKTNKTFGYKTIKQRNITFKKLIKTRK